MSGWSWQLSGGDGAGWLAVAAAVALIGFGWGVWILRREPLSASFRAVLFGLRFLSLALCCLLVAPVLVKFTRTTLARPSVLLLVDGTRSMSLPAGQGGRSRLEQARAALEGVLPSLRRRCRVELAQFGDAELRPMARLEDATARADSTDLAAALEEARRWFAGRPLDAVLVVSDGRLTAGGSPRAAAAALGVPLFTVGFAETTAGGTGRDVAILGVDAPRVCLAGNTVRVAVTLRATGMEPSKHDLEIREGSQPVARGEAIFSKGQRESRAELSFVPGRPGYHVYVVKVSAAGQDSLPRNNEFAFGMNVEQAQRRVCLIESQWRAEYRYLKRCLEEDPNLQFTGFLRAREGQFLQQVEPTRAAAPLPARREDFDWYDTVILGDVNPLTLPPRFSGLLREFVAEDGGGLIVSGGPEVLGPSAARDPDLLALLPVVLGSDKPYRESKYPLWLTPEGTQNPIFHVGVDERRNRALWRSLPELSSVCLFERAKPGAVVLAVHPHLANEFGPQIVVAYHQFGRGRVLVVGTDSTWNWAFQESRAGLDLLHEQFWRQAVRFVARTPGQVSASEGLRAARDVLYEGDTVRLELELPASVAGGTEVAVRGEVVGPQQEKLALAFAPSDPSNRFWQAGFVARQTGPYYVTATASASGGEPLSWETTVCVQSGSPEFENTAVDNVLLRDLAAATGGGFGLLSDLPKLVREMPASRRVESRLIEWESVSSLWLAVVIFGLWTAEWILRKVKDLA